MKANKMKEFIKRNKHWIVLFVVLNEIRGIITVAALAPTLFSFVR